MNIATRRSDQQHTCTTTRTTRRPLKHTRRKTTCMRHTISTDRNTEGPLQLEVDAQPSTIYNTEKLITRLADSFTWPETVNYVIGSYSSCTTCTRVATCNTIRGKLYDEVIRRRALRQLSMFSIYINA
ncbi:hypothetical protein QE152_g5085 [Popillia japonica]|uniref:Uncharacterized protein n=1 Tax=Popillia japonica TaxID=7064 RepID=A0AAW1MXG2_POPJA